MVFREGPVYNRLEHLGSVRVGITIVGWIKPRHPATSIFGSLPTEYFTDSMFWPAAQCLFVGGNGKVIKLRS